MSTGRLLWRVLSVWVCKCWSQSLLSGPWGVCLGVGLLSHSVTICRRFIRSGTVRGPFPVEVTPAGGWSGPGGRMTRACWGMSSFTCSPGSVAHAGVCVSAKGSPDIIGSVSHTWGWGSETTDVSPPMLGPPLPLGPPVTLCGMALWGCGASPGTWDLPSLLDSKSGDGMLPARSVEVCAHHRPHV